MCCLGISNLLKDELLLLLSKPVNYKRFVGGLLTKTE